MPDIVCSPGFNISVPELINFINLKSDKVDSGFSLYSPTRVYSKGDTALVKNVGTVEYVNTISKSGIDPVNDDGSNWLNWSDFIVVDNNNSPYGLPIREGTIIVDSNENNMYKANAILLPNDTINDGSLDSFTLTPTSATTFFNKTIDSITNYVSANKIHLEVINTTGVSILAYTTVKKKDVQAGTGYIEVEPLTDPENEIGIGITTAIILPNQNGSVTTIGTIEGYDTTGLAGGMSIYINNGGLLTTTLPIFNNYQKCGFILDGDNATGSIYVNYEEPTTEETGSSTTVTIMEEEVYDLGSYTTLPGIFSINNNNILFGNTLDNTVVMFNKNLSGSSALGTEAGVSNNYPTTIASNDNTFVIGDTDADTNVGAAYVYDSTGLFLFKIDNTGGSTNSFGASISIDQKILIGDPYRDTNGSVFVCDVDGSNPYNIAPSDIASVTEFGKVLKGFNNTVYSSAVESGAGVMYIMPIDGSSSTKITFSNIPEITSIDVDSNGIVVGAKNGDNPDTINTGVVYVMDINGNITKTIYPSDPEDGQGFGYSVHKTNNIIFVSSPFANSNQGKIYTYSIDGSMEYVLPEEYITSKIGVWLDSDADDLFAIDYDSGSNNKLYKYRLETIRRSRYNINESIVTPTEIIDDLVTDRSDASLSARQGKIIRDINIDEVEPTGFIFSDQTKNGIMEYSPDGFNIYRITSTGSYETTIPSHQEYDSGIATSAYYDGTPASARTFRIMGLSVADGGDDKLYLYNKGIKYSYVNGLSITVDQTKASYGICIDENGAIVYSINPNKNFYKDKTSLATLYGLVDNTNTLFMSDDRHGIRMDGDTRDWVSRHDMIYINGSDISGLTEDGLTMSGVASGTYLQGDKELTLSTVADLPKIYLDVNQWTLDTIDTSVGLLVTNTAQYNVNNGTASSPNYGLTDLTGTDVMPMFLVATNNRIYPYILIPGQQPHTDMISLFNNIEKDWIDIKENNTVFKFYLKPIAVIAVDVNGGVKSFSGGSLYYDLRGIEINNKSKSLPVLHHNDLLEKNEIASHIAEAIEFITGVSVKQKITLIDSSLNGKEDKSQKGQPDGYAPLVNGQIPTGYLPSTVDTIVEVDHYSDLPAIGDGNTIYSVLQDENNGNIKTTYRWGGSSYVLISSNMSANDILNLIKTVDGQNSGLDTDLFNGYGLSHFTTNGPGINFGTKYVTNDVDDAGDSGWYTLDGSINAPSSTSVLLHIESLNTTGQTALQFTVGSSGKIYARAGTGASGSSNRTWTTWGELWSSTNQGTNSGLDADLVRGITPDKFVRNDTTNTAVEIVDSFDVDGSGPGEQRDGLYMTDLGTTQGSTLNPVATLAICAQINNYRSIALSVDYDGYLWGFKSHSNPLTYTFKSKVKEADNAQTVGGILASDLYQKSIQNTDDFSCGNILINGGAFISNGVDIWGNVDAWQGTNIDHIWHDDTTDTWHMCSDTTYKAEGNSNLKINNLDVQQIKAYKPDSVATITVDKAVATEYSGIAFTQNGVGRWILYTANTSEDGGNTGNDLYLQARDDAGNYLYNVLRLRRFSGVLDFYVLPTFSGHDILHKGDMGADSGIDADLVRGITPDKFVRNDTVNIAVEIVDSFDVNGSGPGEQRDGLYIGNLGTIQGSTLNPTYSVAICAQISGDRSIALSVDTDGYLWGFKTHSAPGTYIFKSKVKEADNAQTIGGVNISNLPKLNAGNVFTESNIFSNDSTGTIRINKSSDLAYSGIEFTTAGKQNFLLYTKNDGSGDLGFQTRNYDTDGSYKDTVFSVSWDTGVIHFNIAPTILGYDILHKGDMGANSGIDADLIRGITPDKFVRNDVANTITNKIKIEMSNPEFDFVSDYAGDGKNWDFVGYGSDGTFRLRAWDVTSSTVVASFNFYPDGRLLLNGDWAAKLGTISNVSTFLHLNRNDDVNAVLYVNQTGDGDIARFFKGTSTTSTSGTDMITIKNDGTIVSTGNVKVAGTVTAGHFDGLFDSAGSITDGSAYASFPTGLSISEIPSNAIGQATTHGAILTVNHNMNRGWQLAGDKPGRLWIRGIEAGATDGFNPWYKIWTELSDGANSGLDADTVDGLHADKFVRNDIANTITKNITIEMSNPELDFVSDYVGDGKNWDLVGYGADGTFRLRAWNGAISAIVASFNFYPDGRLLLNGNEVYHSGNDSNLVKVNESQEYTKIQRGSISAADTGTFDCTNGTPKFGCTPTGNITLTFTNYQEGAEGKIYLDNSAAVTISVGTNVLRGSSFESDLSVAGMYEIGFSCYNSKVWLSYGESLS